MKTLFTYNFDKQNLNNLNFKQLYEHTRRDAIFAYAFSHKGNIYALRDHLGTIPLYYRIGGRSIKFSTNLSELVKPGDTLDPYGLRAFLAFGTAKLYPLVKAVGIVPPSSVVRFNLKNKSVKIIYRYQFSPKILPKLPHKTALKNHYQHLFFQALSRQIKYPHVGIYLSGGSDSGLIAIALNKLGVKINAYTSTPDGINHSETLLAKENAALAKVVRHQTADISKSIFRNFPTSVCTVYPTPHTSTTSLGVVALWENTQIHKEKQIFFGQNCDTLFGSVFSQEDSFFLSYLPRTLRTWLSRSQRFDQLDFNLINYLGKGINTDPRPLADLNLPPNQTSLTRFQLATLTGMLIGHSPADGEVLSMPVYSKNHLVSNPYYDMDLIEFVLGINPLLRLDFSAKHNLHLGFGKQLHQEVALDFLPESIVFRKKAFTVLVPSSQIGQAFLTNLPIDYQNIPVTELNSRMAVSVLNQWSKSHLINQND